MNEQAEQVIYVEHTQLRRHPRNMRRVYRREDVEQMAASIEARGIIHPLIVAPDPDGDGYLVFCGNLRLAGAEHLDGKAPPLPVIVRDREEAQQLLDMATENLVRADVDPISEAMHYRRILAQPGMTQQELSRQTGVAVSTIASRLRLLDLDEPIQDLVAQGKLPRGRPAAEALLSIPDAKARVEAAQVLATQRADIKLVKAVCTRVRQKLEQDEADAAKRDLAPPLQAALEEGLPPADDARATWNLLADSVSAACKRCPVDVPRDAGLALIWGELSQAVAGECARCSVRDCAQICGQCPLVEFFKSLAGRLNGGR